MPKMLHETAIRQYRDEGYYFPLPILSDDEVAWNRAQLESFEKEQGYSLQGPQRSKSHLLFKWVDDLMRQYLTQLRISSDQIFCAGSRCSGLRNLDRRVLSLGIRS